MPRYSNSDPYAHSFGQKGSADSFERQGSASTYGQPTSKSSYEQQSSYGQPPSQDQPASQSSYDRPRSNGKPTSRSSYDQPRSQRSPAFTQSSPAFTQSSPTFTHSPPTFTQSSPKSLPTSNHAGSYPSSPNPYQALKQQRRSLQLNAPVPKQSSDIPHYPILTSAPPSKKSVALKIVVVGDGGCGKTCLLTTYVKREFPSVYVPTIFENYVATLGVPIDPSASVELALWDTAGQEEYDRLRPLSYPGADLFLVCFALDNPVSLQNVRDTWFTEVGHFCPGVPLVLVGTKLDLPSRIAPGDPETLAAEMHAWAYFSCLAKTMTNINTVFDFAVDKLFRLHLHLRNTERSRVNRVSRAFRSSTGSAGSVQSNPGISAGHGHFKNKSLDSSLLEKPLTEDTSTQNPYGQFGKYNDEEFAFINNERKKRRKCVLL